MKLLVLVNLSSGIPDGAIYDFVRAFSEAGDEVMLRFADRHSDFAQMLVDADDFDAVVAAGGDGTVASICYLLRNSGVPILPFPSGTANLLTQNIYSPTETPAIAKLVREGHHLDFDMGELDIDGRRRGFSMMAGCGYDAAIMKDAQANKKMLGPLAYFHAAFTNPNPQVSRFTLTIDGETIECQGVGVLVVNFSKIQGDISLALKNRPRDGYLDVIVLSTDTAWNLLPTFLGASIDRSGKPLAESNVLSYYRGREVYVVADPPLRCQYDGEPLEASTPFTARALPSSVKLIVGDAAFEEFSD
ncbi:MAG: NAD(+)/NADH kinase [Eggerthellaceae bacterium]|nr:NAD(+)/NADH kinase [Eggerthellaceae bacterium]